MRYENLRRNEFTPDLAKVWDDLLDQSDDFSSPFFAHEFAMALGRHRDDLRIAVLRHKGEITGFLPYHRKSGGCAAPVGGPISDYQGVIGEAVDCGRHGNKLMRRCGLSAYDFNHGIASQNLLEDNAFSFSNSLRADLREGFDQWQQEVRARSKQINKLKAMMRRLEREHGALRFERHDTSEEAWRIFVRWKDAALRRQGASGFPGPEWIDALLKDIRQVDTPRFAGLFSTLYAGDRMVAAHFGMRSDRAWQWWFPSYDPEMQVYRPGLLLMLFCVEEAARIGLKELDFGRGDQQYKQQFGTRARRLCEGSLERPEAALGMARLIRKAMQRAANRTLPGDTSTFLRRAGTKVLRAGLI